MKWPKWILVLCLAAPCWAADYTAEVNNPATVTVSIPAGKHYQSGGWDVSDRAVQIVCEPGAELIWKNEAPILIDATGTLGLHVEGCKISSSGERMIGLLVQRNTAGDSIGKVHLERVEIEGRYQLGTVYLLSAEGVYLEASWLKNQSDTGPCLVTKRSGAQSPRFTNTMPLTAVGTSFGQYGQAPAVLIGDFTRHAVFCHGSMSAKKSTAALLVSGQQVRGVHLLGVEWESAGKYAVQVTGDAKHCLISGGLLDGELAGVHVAKGGKLHGTIHPFDAGRATVDVLVEGEFEEVQVQKVER